ncbi:MAG TPA: toll/interleukin-1 receptor domain-containing protein [Pseudonocardiaceae bacterium]|jgi:hypothetical protein|nr:toll/interleukin-1 receptor domain-containing protein [Pseudonocardiaceae bacterium]
MPDYQFDVFLSYRRAGGLPDWMRNHFRPVLEECLADEMTHDPRVFLDTDIHTGSHWPAEVERALRTSRLLLPVWTPQYFTSPWCTAEWQTMTKREEAIGLGTVERPHGLIHPVVYSDWDNFPAEAKMLQCRDMKPWARPQPQFRRTELYLDFYADMQAFAGHLAKIIDVAPDWCADWPVVRPTEILRPPPEGPLL